MYEVIFVNFFSFVYFVFIEVLIYVYELRFLREILIFLIIFKLNKVY